MLPDYGAMLVRNARPDGGCAGMGHGMTFADVLAGMGCGCGVVAGSLGIEAALCAPHPQPRQGPSLISRPRSISYPLASHPAVWSLSCISSRSLSFFILSRSVLFLASLPAFSSFLSHLYPLLRTSQRCTRAQTLGIVRGRQARAGDSTSTPRQSG